MKGADSALPVWADFMQKALDMHPEWNGDWAMPANVRKAEIDIRNGALIRELDATEPSPTPVPSPAATKRNTAGPDDPYYEPVPQPEPEIYVTNVPPEFRRVELFIAGTVPNRSLLPVDDGSEPGPPGSHGTPTPSPVTGTWQDSEPNGDPNAPPEGGRDPKSPPAAEPSRGTRGPDGRAGMVTVMICPLTGMRATVNCPEKKAKTFKAGTEPKEFCTFHR
jgi:hypothetical protein